MNEDELIILLNKNTDEKLENDTEILDLSKISDDLNDNEYVLEIEKMIDEIVNKNKDRNVKVLLTRNDLINMNHNVIHKLMFNDKSFFRRGNNDLYLRCKNEKNIRENKLNFSRNYIEFLNYLVDGDNENYSENRFFDEDLDHYIKFGGKEKIESKYLIYTVGFEPYITMKSMNMFKGVEKIFLIYTEEAKKYYEVLKKASEILHRNAEIVEILVDSDDPIKINNALNNKLHTEDNEGMISFDISGGKISTIASAVMNSFINFSDERIKYYYLDPKVYPPKYGEEELIEVINPNKIYSDKERQILKKLIDTKNYESALEYLIEIDKKVKEIRLVFKDLYQLDKIDKEISKLRDYLIFYCMRYKSRKEIRIGDLELSKKDINNCQIKSILDSLDYYSEKDEKSNTKLKNINCYDYFLTGKNLETVDVQLGLQFIASAYSGFMELIDKKRKDELKEEHYSIRSVRNESSIIHGKKSIDSFQELEFSKFKSIINEDINKSYETMDGLDTIKELLIYKSYNEIIDKHEIINKEKYAGNSSIKESPVIAIELNKLSEAYNKKLSSNYNQIDILEAEIDRTINEFNKIDINKDTDAVTNIIRESFLLHYLFYFRECELKRNDFENKKYDLVVYSTGMAPYNTLLSLTLLETDNVLLIETGKSKCSRKLIDKYINLLNIILDRNTVLCDCDNLYLDDQADFAKSFEIINEKLDKLTIQNYNKIAIDITAGKKPTSLAGYFYASLNDNFDIYYISAKKYNKHNNSIPIYGEEYMLKLPNIVEKTRFIEIESAIKLFNTGNYEGVKIILEEIKSYKDDLSEENMKILDDLERLSTIYIQRRNGEYVFEDSLINEDNLINNDFEISSLEELEKFNKIEKISSKTIKNILDKSRENIKNNEDIRDNKSIIEEVTKLKRKADGISNILFAKKFVGNEKTLKIEALNRYAVADNLEKLNDVSAFLRYMSIIELVGAYVVLKTDYEKDNKDRLETNLKNKIAKIEDYYMENYYEDEGGLYCGIERIKLDNLGSLKDTSKSSIIKVLDEYREKRNNLFLNHSNKSDGINNDGKKAILDYINIVFCSGYREFTIDNIDDKLNELGLDFREYKESEENVNNLGLIFSHKLTKEQKKFAEIELKINKFLYLPEELQVIWSNIPAELESLGEYLEKIKAWIKNNFEKKDYLLIQGDFGATFELVKYSKELELIPVYATTKRSVIENEKKDGSIETIRTFKHVRYRRY